MPEELRNVIAGRDHFPATHAIPRHRHQHAYAIVTLSGSIQQVSYAGRLSTRPGQLLIQPTLDCHSNRSSPSGVEILRLPWRREGGLGGLFEVDDIDQVVRTAEKDPIAASEYAFGLVRSHEPLPAKHDDWEDQLAADLARDRFSSLRDWAKQNGLARETLSRGFARRFHCTPARFRFELKTRDAWLRLTGTNDPLSAVAVDVGFADQAHMSRAIKWMTGHAPGFWRRTSPC